MPDDVALTHLFQRAPFAVALALGRCCGLVTGVDGAVFAGGFCFGEGGATATILGVVADGEVDEGFPAVGDALVQDAHRAGFTDDGFA